MLPAPRSRQSRDRNTGLKKGRHSNDISDHSVAVYVRRLKPSPEARSRPQATARPCHVGLENGGAKSQILGLPLCLLTFPHLGGHRDPLKADLLPYRYAPSRAHRTQLTPSTLPTVTRPRYPRRSERRGRSTHHVSTSLSDILLGGQTSPSRSPYTGLGLRRP